MVTVDKLFNIFKDTSITREEIVRLIYYCRLSYKYLLVGSMAEFKILKIDEKFLWPIFCKNIFRDQQASIYRHAQDKNVVSRFIDTINVEYDIRRKLTRKSRWIDLKNVLYKRTSLFPSILSFSKSDFDSCQKESEALQRRLLKRIRFRRNHNLIRGAKIGFGVAAGLGTALLVLGKVRKNGQK